MSPALVDALDLLRGLQEGDLVVVTLDHRDVPCKVVRPYRRGMESAEHATATVGFGPGRWNREVSAKSMVDGYVGLRRASVADLGNEIGPPE